MVYTKTVQIHCKDLGQSVTWMFCFLNPYDNKNFKEYFPVAWRVVTIPAEGSYIFTLTYSSAPTFSKVQKESGNLITATTWQACDRGQRTTLTGNVEQGYSFSNVGGDAAIAANGTDSVQSMGFGFLDDGWQSTVLYFDSVQPQNQIAPQLTANLSGYITASYRETQIIDASIQSSAPSWTINMEDPEAPTQYDMKYNDQTGRFEINART